MESMCYSVRPDGLDSGQSPSNFISSYHLLHFTFGAGNMLTCRDVHVLHIIMFSQKVPSNHCGSSSSGPCLVLGPDLTDTKLLFYFFSALHFVLLNPCNRALSLLLGGKKISGTGGVISFHFLLLSGHRPRLDEKNICPDGAIAEKDEGVFKGKLPNVT
jgi:hypothetical protein